MSYMNATVGTQAAKQLFAPMDDLPLLLCGISFDLLRDTDVKQEDVTLRALQSGVFRESEFGVLCQRLVDQHTDDRAMAQLAAAVEQRFQALRNRLTAYAAREGKEALYQVYLGRFAQENSQLGIGLREMLTRMAYEYGPARGEKEVHYSEYRFREAEMRVMETHSILTVLDIGGKGKMMAADWVRSLNRMYSDKIMLARLDAMFGRGGIFEKQVLIPLDQLVRDLTAS